jgi:hypothetical protein
MPVTLNQVINVSVFAFVICLFILKAILNIREARRKLHNRDLSSWSKTWAVFILFSSAVVVLVAMAIIGLLFVNLF